MLSDGVDLGAKCAVRGKSGVKYAFSGGRSWPVRQALWNNLAKLQEVTLLLIWEETSEITG